MYRKFVLAGALAASMVVGCTNQKKEDQMAAEQKYKILSGSTSEDRARSGDEQAWAEAKEPQLRADTRFAAGRVAETQGKYDCALVQYDQALRLNPKHVPTLYRMGIVYTRTKQFDKAVDTWNKYIKATGGIASGYSNLGFTYEMAADVDNAEKAYQKGLEIDPQDKACRVNYGLMLARNNRDQEATAQLTMVLKPAEVSYNLGQIYEQQGAMAAAKDEYRKALESNPQMREAQMRLANLPQD